ncbi:diguanylate cyclase, partial [Desulfovibrio desulfuricans]
DLNGLKKINDELGHQIGDEYIRRAAVILSKCAGIHPVYRFGGDEFVILVNEGNDKAMKMLCERILAYTQA